MSESLRELLRPKRALGPRPSTVLVYGAGSMGRRVAQLLQAAGISVAAFLDRNARAGSTWNGIPEVTAADWSRVHPQAGQAVIVAIHNPAHQLGGLFDELARQGFGPVLSLMDLCRWFPGALQGGYWLASPDLYAEHIEEIETVHALLADEASRRTLRNVLEFRVNGDYGVLDIPELGQYFPATLPRWPEALRLIDCGAFDGDTLAAARTAGYTLEAAVCLEPDPVNYRRLVAAVRGQDLPVSCLPCAAGRTAQMLKFSAEGADSSHADEQGETLIQAVGLDEAFANFAPNLIKMDIEGAEIEALQGARQLIEAYQPGLAISLYHHPEHLWRIPLLLRDWLPHHRFSIRSHAHNTFELVMYAHRPIA